LRLLRRNALQENAAWAGDRSPHPGSASLQSAARLGTGIPELREEWLEVDRPDRYRLVARNCRGTIQALWTVARHDMLEQMTSIDPWRGDEDGLSATSI
jgi:hypothetical protein